MRLTDLTNGKRDISDNKIVESGLFKALLGAGLKRAKEIKENVFGKGYAIHASSISIEGYDKPIQVVIGIPLKKSIDPEVEERVDENQNLLAFKRELEKFQTMLPELMETYPNEFVAILNGEVVGRDKDELELAKKIYKKYLTQFVFIRQVKEELPVTFALESPEGVV